MRKGKEGSQKEEKGAQKKDAQKKGAQKRRHYLLQQRQWLFPLMCHTLIGFCALFHQTQHLTQKADHIHHVDHDPRHHGSQETDQIHVHDRIQSPGSGRSSGSHGLDL